MVLAIPSQPPTAPASPQGGCAHGRLPCAMLTIRQPAAKVCQCQAASEAPTASSSLPEPCSLAGCCLRRLSELRGARARPEPPRRPGPGGARRLSSRFIEQQLDRRKASCCGGCSVYVSLGSLKSVDARKPRSNRRTEGNLLKRLVLSGFESKPGASPQSCCTGTTPHGDCASACSFWPVLDT